MSEQENNLSQPKSEDHIADYYEGVKKLEMQGHENGIKKARNALFITAGVLLVGEIVFASLQNVQLTPLAIGIIAVEVGTFIALGFWTKSKPYTAIIVGIIFFLLLWVFAIIVTGIEAAYRGIILRIIILSVLISALKSAKAWESLKKSSEH